jgi:hypothetical protein
LLSMLCRRCQRLAGPAQGRDWRGAVSGVLECFEVFWRLVGGWSAVLGPVCWDAARDVGGMPGWRDGSGWWLRRRRGAGAAGSSRGAPPRQGRAAGLLSLSVRTRAGCCGNRVTGGDPRAGPTRL